MVKPKALCIIRISTEAQEIEEQRKQTIQMALDDGYEKDEIVVVGGVASAIKCDDAYMKNLNETYKLLEEHDTIKCIYAWEVSRIGRKESILHQFREYLVAHRIQLKIRVGGLVLLDDDGRESIGVKIAFSLFAAMAVAEMETKKARFKRSKDRNRAQGRMNGGSILFGYTTDSNGFFIIQKEDAALVRTIYRMYASGRYSIHSLTEELISQGYTHHGDCLNPATVGGWLRYADSYAGKGEIKYPQLLDQALVDKVKAQLKNAINSTPRASKKIYFASRLLKCECGRYLCGKSNSYTCASNATRSKLLLMGRTVCEYAISPGVPMIDNLLWSIAREIHLERLGELSEERIKETKAEIDILAKKLAFLNSKIAGFDTKKKRLTSAYVLGDFNDEEFEALKKKLLDGHTRLLEEQLTMMNRYISLMGFLDENNVKVGDPEEMIRDIEARNDRKEMNEIIRKYITGGMVKRSEYQGFKGFEIEVVSVVGARRFMYMARRKNGEKMIEI